MCMCRYASCVPATVVKLFIIFNIIIITFFLSSLNHRLRHAAATHLMSYKHRG